MSCTFWIRRKRLAAKRAAEQKETISEKETVTVPDEKAVTTNDNKRTGRKSKAGDSSD